MFPVFCADFSWLCLLLTVLTSVGCVFYCQTVLTSLGCVCFSDCFDFSWLCLLLTVLTSVGCVSG